MVGVNSQFQTFVFKMPRTKTSKPEPDLIEIPEESGQDFGVGDGLAGRCVFDQTPVRKRPAPLGSVAGGDGPGTLGPVSVSLSFAEAQRPGHDPSEIPQGQREVLCRQAAPQGIPADAQERVPRRPLQVRSIGRAYPGRRHVKNALKKICAKGRGRGRGQAPALREAELEKLVSACDAAFSLWGLRDSALFSVAFDAGLRIGEAAALQVQDIDFRPEGHARVTIRSSKTDQTGHGATQIVRSHTAKRLERWLDVAGITDGPLFRKIINGESSRTEFGRIKSSC